MDHENENIGGYVKPKPEKPETYDGRSNFLAVNTLIYSIASYKKRDAAMW